jgi:UDP-N-acetylglucosamine 2-epimerase (non-hydrolysing)
MNITIIAGARPNFMKIAPLIHEIKRRSAKSKSNESNEFKLLFRLVHTGQHYDSSMSDTFFEELNIPQPDINLGCGGGSQATQTACIMIEFEKELQANPADLVIVVGDVTSTMACSIVAKKLNTRVAHIEAGIRSYDMTMPEEINRMVTDTLADYFFTTTNLAGENLRRSGISDDRIYFVGNVMIDSLKENRLRFRRPEVWDRIGLKKSGYIVTTIHRPNNVDNHLHLISLLEAIMESSNGLPVIFPVHPRTKLMIDQHLAKHPILSSERLITIPPLGYLEFNYLVENAKAVITDSGGITEETTVLGIPCITLRDNTERPETVTIGTNELIGTNPAALAPAMKKLFSGNWKKGGIPGLWDGKASSRIVDILEEIESRSHQL